MKFTFVTLFSNLIEGYFQDSILKRAINKELIQIEYLDPRDFSQNKHSKVDDTAVGGGAGMVMNPQPLYDSLDELKKQVLPEHHPARSNVNPGSKKAI